MNELYLKCSTYTCLIYVDQNFRRAAKAPKKTLYPPKLYKSSILDINLNILAIFGPIELCCGYNIFVALTYLNLRSLLL